MPTKTADAGSAPISRRVHEAYGSLPDGELQRLIDQSYALVVRGLPAATRRGLEARHGRAALYGAAA